jgi:SAM-dependent methyltransferase
MDLMDIIHRQAVPGPWAEGEKIPWNDPAFSQRMLLEHLSQEHDAASRRFETIDEQVEWIHRTVLSGQPTRILDLGCGPGLYTSRLARLGHDCVGIDFSPASIDYAREAARLQGLPCTYVREDIRAADYGHGYGLAMLIFGELNVFRPAEAQSVLTKACQALVDGGRLLLEVHTFAAVQALCDAPRSWYSSEGGLFLDRPHLGLLETFWDGDVNVATERYFIVAGLTGDVTRHAASTQAYSDELYRSLLRESGFGEVAFHPSLRGVVDESQRGLFVIVAERLRPHS